jgi:hypothetical protein
MIASLNIYKGGVVMSNIKKVLIDFMEEIRDYVRESGRNLAHDDRESEEFVDIFIKYNPELFKTKRQPLADGTLPLTIGEFSEFSEMMGYENTSEIFYDNKLHFKCFSKGWGIITDVKAILYLAERFNLTEESK